MDRKFISIAIDGPSASGKSTIAKLLAARLGFTYIDTGAMYRAFTLAMILKGLNPEDEKLAESLINVVEIEFDSNNHILLDNIDVNARIRDNDVADNVSYIASYKNVRLFLVDLQRKIASGKNVVMDGRDIGTYVLKDAEIKIFMIADVNERAKRRYIQNKENNRETSFEECLENIKKRDYIDSHRSFCPLQPAKDSITLDTTNLTIEEVVNKIDEIIVNKGYKECLCH